MLSFGINVGILLTACLIAYGICYYIFSFIRYWFFWKLFSIDYFSRNEKEEKGLTDINEYKKKKLDAKIEKIKKSIDPNAINNREKYYLVDLFNDDPNVNSIIEKLDNEKIRKINLKVMELNCKMFDKDHWPALSCQINNFLEIISDEELFEDEAIFEEKFRDNFRIGLKDLKDHINLYSSLFKKAGLKVPVIKTKVYQDLLDKDTFEDYYSLVKSFSDYSSPPYALFNTFIKSDYFYSSFKDYIKKTDCDQAEIYYLLKNVYRLRNNIS